MMNFITNQFSFFAEILYNNPLHSVVMIFHQVTGIPLELLNNKEDFLRALIQKFYR